MADPSDEQACVAALRKLGTDEYVASLVHTYLIAPENTIEEDCLRILVERHFPNSVARDAVLEAASVAIREARS